MLVRFLVILAIGYVALCLVVYLTQAKLVYFPGREPRATPADFGLEFRELQLRTKDGVGLHGWFLPVEGARGAVLVSHGNAGTIELRIELARSFVELGWSVLLYDYRGYGKSAGEPDEEGTYRDAEAAYEHLTTAEGFAGERVVLYGESLGAAVAIELARRRPCAAVIGESAFTSLPDVGAIAYPFLPVRLIARFRYDNLAKVAELGVPLLLIHSPGDEIVPVEHGQRLFQAAREPKRMLLTEGGHNDGGFQQRPEWRAEVGAFLEGLVGASR
jgi:fermentation-respiration switch protein FrsA (DUF1100 family)